MRFILTALACSLICAGASAQAPGPVAPSARFAIIRIQVADLAKIEPFYRNVLGMTDGRGSNATEKVLAFADPGTPVLVLALTKQALPASDATPFAVSVSDMDGVLKKTPQYGGTIAQAARSIGAYGRIAFIRDPAGTRIEILEAPKAP